MLSATVRALHSPAYQIAEIFAGRDIGYPGWQIQLLPGRAVSSGVESVTHNRTLQSGCSRFHR
jgi:hypothetical protein